ncbi:inner membrane transporter RhtA [Actinoplanes lutulentus]|uniref:EamA family transporter n=1 Tax=Actinoplanes lutulentus TaxID=1287878 RepID=UPI0017CE208B|nr:EamA family transporter [Actinoplanes lutulentus]MBB2949241.1 inner membrane transporter RhtA [Actinoplanes lutulentus]
MRTKSGPVLVLGSVLSLQFGGAVAALLFPRAGVHGVVALRLAIAALILLAICRPRTRGYRRADWLSIAAFGIALAGLNTLFYHAIDRIPMGTAVTLEVLGPLTLSVITARSRRGWMWAGLALAGVVLLGRGGFGRLDPAGVGFALGAAVMWAAYIVLSARVGHRFPKADGLALAVAASAVITLPFGVAEAGSVLLEPRILLMGTVVAVLASVLPYSLEMLALRRMPTTTFAVLMSLGPAVAALAGFLLLGQALTLLECLAILLVITAAMGAVTGTKPAPGAVTGTRPAPGAVAGTKPAPGPVSPASPVRTPSRTEARRTLAPATPDA